MAASLPLNPPAVPVAEESAPSRNTVWRRFRRHKVALAGGVVIIIMALIAIGANILTPADPNFIDQVNCRATRSHRVSRTTSWAPTRTGAICSRA